MNGDIKLAVFNLFVSAEFLRADQLWKIQHWEALRNSPFPILSAVPSPTVIFLPEPEPATFVPAP